MSTRALLILTGVVVFVGTFAAAYLFIYALFATT